MKAEDVANAARDVALIVHAANPPRYKNWRGLAMPMLRNSIEAASASNARLIFPGNLYNFGPDAAPLLSETAPQNPNTRKGRVRSEMEDMLRAAAATGTRSLVVRAGDVFGGHGPSSNFSNVLIKPREPLRAIVYPGPPATGHAWAYLPDYAEAIARLADIEAGLPSFDVFHFGGHWIEPGIELAQSIHVELDGFRPGDLSGDALGESLQILDVGGGPGSDRTQLQPIAGRRGGQQRCGSQGLHLSSLEAQQTALSDCYGLLGPDATPQLTCLKQLRPPPSMLTQVNSGRRALA